MEKINIKNLSDLEIFADKVVVDILQLNNREEALVVSLSGNLGAGKTTFVQTLAKKMGVTEKVTSPTFTIMKSYPLQGEFSTLIHMDAYRIDDLSELKPLRFYELLKNNKNIIFIEWSEKIISALPQSGISIEIGLLGSDEREFTYCKK